MSEIFDVLKNVPDLTWHNKKTSIDEIDTLIKKGVKYEGIERRIKKYEEFKNSMVEE